jgi:hypothetical protein
VLVDGLASLDLVLSRAAVSRAEHDLGVAPCAMDSCVGLPASGHWEQRVRRVVVINVAAVVAVA